MIEADEQAYPLIDKMIENELESSDIPVRPYPYHSRLIHGSDLRLVMVQYEMAHIAVVAADNDGRGAPQAVHHCHVNLFTVYVEQSPTAHVNCPGLKVAGIEPLWLARGQCVTHRSTA